MLPLSKRIQAESVLWSMCLRWCRIWKMRVTVAIGRLLRRRGYVVFWWRALYRYSCDMVLGVGEIWCWDQQKVISSIHLNVIRSGITISTMVRLYLAVILRFFPSSRAVIYQINDFLALCFSSCINRLSDGMFTPWPRDFRDCIHLPMAKITFCDINEGETSSKGD